MSQTHAHLLCTLMTMASTQNRVKSFYIAPTHKPTSKHMDTHTYIHPQNRCLRPSESEPSRGLMADPLFALIQRQHTTTHTLNYLLLGHRPLSPHSKPHRSCFPETRCSKLWSFFLDIYWLMVTMAVLWLGVWKHFDVSHKSFAWRMFQFGTL